MQSLQMQHRHVLDMVAFYLGVDPNEVVDGVLDDANTLPYFLNLFVEHGKACCLVYYQVGDNPPLGN